METIDFNFFKQLDLRVAKILEAQKHPDADRLLLLKIDVGEEDTKQIVAGIAEHYAPEDLPGRSIVVVNNLEPATIRGEDSNGMLLAAKDETTFALLGVDNVLPPGARVG